MDYADMQGVLISVQYNYVSVYPTMGFEGKCKLSGKLKLMGCVDMQGVVLSALY